VNPRRMSDEQVAAQVRDRVGAAESRIPVPDDLMDRVTAPRRRFRPAPRRWPTMVVAAAAVIGIAGGAGFTAYAMKDRKPQAGPAAGTTDVRITVFNAERPCQALRTIECSLGVLSDPYTPSAQKVVGRVWHGDQVTALCTVADGKRVADETGVTSIRWYRIRTADGVVGYVPGVRFRNTVEVQLCPPRK
jgi:hypothetical protein